MSSLNCPCGFKAQYKSKLIKHLNAINKCKYLKDLEANKNLEEVNNEEHNKDNEDIEIIAKKMDEWLAKTELNTMMIKSFKTIYDNSDPLKKKLLLKNENYKEHLNLLMNNDNHQPTQEIIGDNNNLVTAENSNVNITTTTNSNNQITINNNINNNITVVYPFGYENIYFMTDEEMVEILTSNKCLIDAMNKIYSNVENKNFMKRNVKVDQVTVIAASFNINVMTDNAFKRKIIKNTFDALKRMFYHCKDRLKIEHQIMLWQNLRILDESIKENMSLNNEEHMSRELHEIMENIDCIINQENESIQSKEQFCEIKTGLVNEENKRLFNEKLDHIVAKIREFNEDYVNRTIDINFIQNQIWTKNLNLDPELSVKHPANHIIHHDVITTPRFKFIQEMETLENKYLDTDDNNTTGNIDTVCDVREKIASKEFENYKDNFELNLKERKTLERKVKTEKKYKARDKMAANQKTIMKSMKSAEEPKRIIKKKAQPIVTA